MDDFCHQTNEAQLAFYVRSVLNSDIFPRKKNFEASEKENYRAPKEGEGKNLGHI